MNKKQICGIVIGDMGTPSKAERFGKKLKNCPYMLLQAADSNKLYSVFIVPERQKWWLEYIEIHPKEVGYKKAKVYISSQIFFPEIFKLRLPLIKTKIVPCGANCAKCPSKEKYNCLCCPATIHFRG